MCTCIMYVTYNTESQQDDEYNNSATAELARVGGHYAVQSHYRVTNVDTDRKFVCNLHPISHRF